MADLDVINAFRLVLWAESHEPQASGRDCDVGTAADGSPAQKSRPLSARAQRQALMNRRGFLGSVIAVLMAPFAAKYAPKIVLTPYTDTISLFNPSADVATLYRGGMLSRNAGWSEWTVSGLKTGDIFTIEGVNAVNQPTRLQQFTAIDSRDWCGTEL